MTATIHAAAAFGTIAAEESPTTTQTTAAMAAGGAGLSKRTRLASLELEYFKAVSLYRRRNYEKCTEVCNAMLQAGHDNNIQMFATPPDQQEDDEEQYDDNDEGNSNSNNNANVTGGSSSNSLGYSSNLQRIGPKPLGRRRLIGDGGIGNGNGGGGAETGNNNNKVTIMPTWLMEGVWQLKMRALTQRVYIDDLETNDADNEVNEDVEFERIATTARPGTSIKTAFVPRPSTSNRQRTAGRPQTNARSSDGRLSSARPTSGMIRPGTSLSRPGSALGTRPASRCATASRVRATSAAAYRVGDATAKMYQASRMNPTIYAERVMLVKALFQFLFYHEADLQKAYSLCDAVLAARKQQQVQIVPTRSASDVDWWWYQQMGRCLLSLHYPRKAEPYLEQSLAAFPHPDTYLLLSRLYQRLKQHDRALQIITDAVDKNPFNIIYRTEQARIFDVMSKPDDAIQIYRLITKLNPINVEALACIALNYFYDNNPEMALLYYRRILALGFHTAELYCNIALCCLYGGQLDLVLPCFQRALQMAHSADQKADIWYNLSFVAITTGDLNLARRCLNLCLTSDARNGGALNNLAVLAVHNGDILNAKSYLSAAKDVLQDSSEVECNLKYMESHYKL